MAHEEEQSPSGSPIHRYKERSKPFMPAIGDSDNIEAISKHIAKHIGEPASVFHEIVSDLVHIDVHVVAPTDERPYYTLVTSGMSERPMNVPEGADDFRYAELMITLPRNWQLGMDQQTTEGGPLADERNYWPIRWLKMLARMPHEYDTWLGLGHTVPTGDPPQPYAPNTKLCCLMCMLPLIAPDEFATLELPDRRVHFYSLLPLYRQEMDYKLRHGAEALLQRLDQLGGPEAVEVVNIDRPNTCRKRFWLF